ncbi:M23 family metallopeptidase [Rhodococcus sp. NPDC127528]|uniref:M23 family metallopeptidase n=1 Tax=unclassified Rhodococcus (in: high G+C Gram-positive bacteria) TaxID=192944 RepID=UPI0036404C95
MGDHRRSNRHVTAFRIDPDAMRGRHRAQAAGSGAGVKAATVAAATGAILAGGAQLGAASASAAPIQLPTLPTEVTNLLPAGVELPTSIEVPDVPAADSIPGFATARQWVDDQAKQFSPLKARTVQPVSGTLTSDFGSRWGAHHGGLDIAAPIGTPIRAAADGTVISAGPASGFGQWVRVMHEDRTITVYGHVNDYQVTVGQQVVAGQQIATVGNRGESTGPHLHFEVWDTTGTKVDPAKWLRDNGVTVTWTGNGHNDQ